MDFSVGRCWLFTGKPPHPRQGYLWCFSFGSSASSRTDLLLSCWRVCEDRVGEKDMSCHCFMKNRFSLNAHFLRKTSPEPPVLLVSPNLKASKCFLLSEEMHSLNGREGGQNESYLSYLVEHLLLIGSNIVLWCYDVSFSVSKVLVLSNSKPSCSIDINQYVWLRVPRCSGT